MIRVNEGVSKMTCRNKQMDLNLLCKTISHWLWLGHCTNTGSEKHFLVTTVRGSHQYFINTTQPNSKF